MEVNRPSLYKLYQGCQASGSPEPHSIRTHRTAGAFSPQQDTCPPRMGVFLLHCAADMKQKSHWSSLQAGDCTEPSNFLFSLCSPRPRLSRQLMGRSGAHKRMCAPVLKMSHRKTRENQRGEEYLHACEYPLQPFHIHHHMSSLLQSFPPPTHFKEVQTETDSKHSSTFPFIDKRDVVQLLTLGQRISDWSSA